MSVNYTYFGNTSLSAKILTGLCQVGLRPSLVVTTKGKPAGRGLKIKSSVVVDFCQQQELPYIEIMSLKTTEVQQELIKHQTDSAVLAAFGKIIPPEVLSIYKHGIVNVHPSLLPRYRGPSPLQYALLNNDSQTGVSLIVLDNEIDHGPIIAQQSISLSQTDTYADLESKATTVAVELLVANFEKYLKSDVTLKPQDHAAATFTKMITKNMGQADFNLSAKELHNKQRAFSVWPKLWTTWRGEIIKLITTNTLSGQLPIGVVGVIDEHIGVGTKQDILVIEQIQLAGKKIIPIKEFMLGHQDFVGSRLGSS